MKGEVPRPPGEPWGPRDAQSPGPGLFSQPTLPLLACSEIPDQGIWEVRRGPPTRSLRPSRARPPRAGSGDPPRPGVGTEGWGRRTRAGRSGCAGCWRRSRSQRAASLARAAAAAAARSLSAAPRPGRRDERAWAPPPASLGAAASRRGWGWAVPPASPTRALRERDCPLSFLRCSCLTPCPRVPSWPHVPLVSPHVSPDTDIPSAAPPPRRVPPSCPRVPLSYCRTFCRSFPRFLWHLKFFPLLNLPFPSSFQTLSGV